MRRLCILAVLLAAAGASLAACGAEDVVQNSGTSATGTAVGEFAEETGSESGSRPRPSAEPESAYGSWSEPEVIPGTTGASSVEIGVDAAGNVVAGWLGGRRVVYVAIRSVATGRWTTPLPMRRAQQLSGLSLAVSPNGAFVLAWHGLNGRRGYAMTGTVAAGARPPRAIGDSHEQPAVAISADGVATVAWSRSDPAEFYPSESRVVTRRVNAQTGDWGRSIDFATRWRGNVAAVAVNASGDAALLWDSCWFDHGSVNGCTALRVATRAAGKATWAATRLAPNVDIYDTGGDGRALGITEDRSPTVVWAGYVGVQAASPRAGGWTKTTVSGPDVNVSPSFSEGVALDVDEQGRAVAAWRGSPDACGESHAIEVTVRGDGMASWDAPRRLATLEFEALDPCERASNPAVVLARDTALVAWREYRAPASVVRLLWLSPGDTRPADTVSFDAPGSFGKPTLAANESGFVAAAWSDERGAVVTFNRADP